MSQDVRSSGGGRLGSRSFGSGGGGRPRFFRGDGRGGGVVGAPRMGSGRFTNDRGGRMEQQREEEAMPMLGGGRGKPAAAAPKKQLQGYWGADKKKQADRTDRPSPTSLDTPKAGSGGPTPNNANAMVKATTAQANRGMIQQRKPQRLQTVPVDKINISGTVVLNIIKHCCKGGAQSSKVHTGHIYGLKYPSSGMTEVTYSIPTPDTSKTRTDDAEFCKSFMSCVESTGVDQMEVGWYRSCSNGNFYDESTVTRCFEWQTMNEHSFLLVFDPSATIKSGRLVLRGFQLTPKFIALRQSGDRFGGMGHTAIHEREITFHNIFREIPVAVHNSYLAHAFLFEHQNACPFDRLSHNANADVSEGLTALGRLIEEYQPLQSQYRNWRSQVNRVLKQREAAEAEGTGSASFVAAKYPFPPEPSRLKSMLVLAQMHENATAIHKSTIQSQSNLLIDAPQTS